MRILINNIFNKKTLLCKPVKISHIQRSMLRQTFDSALAKIGQKCVLAPATRIVPINRNMGIVPYKFKKAYSQEKNPERDAQDIPYHLGSHTFGIDEDTGNVVVLFTSAKGKNMPPEVYIEKVSSEKLDGKFTPLLDPITKKPLLDANGNQIPDPNKGGQYMAVLPIRRSVSAESKGSLLTADQLEKLYPGIHAYIQKHQSKIQSIIATANAKHGANTKLTKQLGGKDDE